MDDGRGEKTGTYDFEKRNYIPLGQRGKGGTFITLISDEEEWDAFGKKRGHDK